MKRTHWISCGCGLLLSLIPGCLLLFWQHTRAGAPAPVVHDKATAAATDLSIILDEWKATRQAHDPHGLEKWRASRSLSRLSARECETLAERALALPKNEQDALLCDMLSAWAALDGSEALSWAVTALPWYHAAMLQAGSIWAWRKPQEVLMWQQSMIEKNEKSHKMIVRAVVESWLARSDAQACAQAYVAGLTKKSSSPSGWVVISQAVTSPEQAQAFARGLESGQEKMLSSEHFRGEASEVVSVLCERWLELDPKGWETWAAAHPELADLASSHAKSQDARFQAVRDKASEAARWLAQSPPENQAATMGQIINTWAARDLDAAGAWLAAQVSAQGSGENAWAAAEAFAKHAAIVDPAAAFQWAATIGDPSRRARAERQTFLRWHDAEPAAAMAWLETSGWSAEQQTAVREMAAVRAR